MRERGAVHRERDHRSHRARPAKERMPLRDPRPRRTRHISGRAIAALTVAVRGRPAPDRVGVAARAYERLARPDLVEHGAVRIHARWRNGRGTRAAPLDRRGPLIPLAAVAALSAGAPAGRDRAGSVIEDVRGTAMINVDRDRSRGARAGPHHHARGAGVRRELAGRQQAQAPDQAHRRHQPHET